MEINAENKVFKKGINFGLSKQVEDEKKKKKVYKQYH